MQLLLPTVSNCNGILAAFNKPKQAKIRSGASQNCCLPVKMRQNEQKKLKKNPPPTIPTVATSWLLFIRSIAATNEIIPVAVKSVSTCATRPHLGSDDLVYEHVPDLTWKEGGKWAEPAITVQWDTPGDLCSRNNGPPRRWDTWRTHCDTQTHTCTQIQK